VGADLASTAAAADLVIPGAAAAGAAGLDTAFFETVLAELAALVGDLFTVVAAGLAAVFLVTILSSAMSLARLFWLRRALKTPEVSWMWTVARVAVFPPVPPSARKAVPLMSP
jgi:hypothetical protein